MTEMLSLNLECQGYRGERWPLRVELLSHAIEHLIADANQGHRVYELFTVKRPGDIWKYVWVGIVEVSDVVRRRCELARTKSALPWLEGQVPFPDFNNLFYGDGWDDEPDDIPWLLWRQSSAFREFCEAGFERVRLTQSALRNSAEILIRHEIALIDRLMHEYDFPQSLPIQLTDSGYVSPVVPGFERAYYTKLQTLLGRADVTSVSYRGEFDYQLFRILCSEQRRRLTVPRTVPLVICALVAQLQEVTPWGAEVTYMDEGIRWGVLHVEHDCKMGLPISEAMRELSPSSRRIVLLHRSAGEIPGYRHEAGEGWVVYDRSDRSEHAGGPTNS